MDTPLCLHDDRDQHVRPESELNLESVDPAGAGHGRRADRSEKKDNAVLQENSAASASNPETSPLRAVGANHGHNKYRVPVKPLSKTGKKKSFSRYALETRWIAQESY
jgi:hypothetical protein